MDQILSFMYSSSSFARHGSNIHSVSGAFPGARDTVLNSLCPLIAYCLLRAGAMKTGHYNAVWYLPLQLHPHCCGNHRAGYFT